MDIKNQKANDSLSFSSTQFQPFNFDLSNILSRNFTGPISAIKLNTELINRMAGGCGLNEGAMKGRVRKILNQANNIESILEDLLLLLRIEQGMLEKSKLDYKILDLEDQLSVCFEEYSACRQHRIEDYLKDVYVNTDLEKTVLAFERLIDLMKDFSSGEKPELIVRLGDDFVNVNITMAYNEKKDFSEWESFFSHRVNFDDNERASMLSLRLYIIKKLFNLADCQIVASKLSNQVTFMIAIPMAQSMMQRKPDSANPDAAA
ncbi:signal transduction histidine kinase [Roseivirga ehrenbergii]|uniref:Uncharacterized protein n=1 Tax=Roseivirga ehrenbergii (strain DSM 102268 / JCM 13514 / KCTC 12282 / NCIMB 14502 / KMM 6017) TaxID=279360 RepID=A0A150WXV1_ROSEK|nr:HAMP domain-containing histidine kinase [Roseivirga ehrenbergii]KYG71321.1 hypothetical protein MB14_11125 [Roseivirga ehrenbergii]TCK99634.1 signal transduction histidine kinase [Roseivirga ehrenbergii]